MNVRWFACFALGLAVGFMPLATRADGPGEADASEHSRQTTRKSEFTWNAAAYNTAYGTEFESLEQAYSGLVLFRDQTIRAPTHLFDMPVNVIPYSNDDGTLAADGHEFRRGDSEIAKVYTEGELGIAVKHRRSEYPTLDLNKAGLAGITEHIKLLDTHVEIVVGVDRDGQPGAITLNNPQGYERGYFGDETYAMVFLRPVYPDYLHADQVRSFEANIRTMLVGFNAVTKFPNNYNAGDPLAARDRKRVQEHVKNMVLALNGDAGARDYFRDRANQVYCAELAFIGFTCGLMVPLNDTTMVPLVGAEAWNHFKGYIQAHNAGRESPFTTMNSNKRVKFVTTLSTAPEDLRPAGVYGSQAEMEKLAFQPMTISDIFEQFMRTHLPREILGEGLAAAQGAVLAQMKPGLLKQLKLNKLSQHDPKRIAVEALYDRMVQVVSTPFDSYEQFRQQIEPLLLQARLVTGPRGNTGEGLFVPPCLYHVIAQGKHRGGLMHLQYAGHGIHQSLVQRISATIEPGSMLADEPLGEEAGANWRDAAGDQQSMNHQDFCRHGHRRTMQPRRLPWRHPCRSHRRCRVRLPAP